MDSRVPPEFIEEIRSISKSFLTPFTRLMTKIKGPAYKPPKFENIKPLESDDIPHQYQPYEASVAAIPPHDVIDMTQPSQYVSQPPIPSATTSSSRPSKLESRRMKEEKWNIAKSLDISKKTKIYDDWGWGIGSKVEMEGGFKVCGYHISDIAMQSLAPGAWIDDRIIYSYMGLLRERDENINIRKVWERKPFYYFMDPYFIVFGKDNMKKSEKQLERVRMKRKKA